MTRIHGAPPSKYFFEKSSGIEQRAATAGAETPSERSLPRIQSSESITVFPVTKRFSAGIPSRARLSKFDFVGAKHQSASGSQRRRFISSGNGERMLKVRSPASTCPIFTPA